MALHQKKFIDLHLHTTCSDGEQSVEEVIDAALQTGLHAIALTDHNCFAIHEPRTVRGMEVIPGCEFSVYYHTKKGVKKEIHIIGLFFDGVNQEMQHFFDGLDRLAYVRAIIEKLNSLGLDITLSEVLDAFPDSKQFGRTLISQVLIQKGFAKNKTDAFDHWIGNYSPHYLDPTEYMNYADMDACVKAIISTGGLPVLAHPYHYHMEDGEVEDLIRSFRSISDAPMGMEVYYWKYVKSSPQLVKTLEKLAVKYSLLPSAASDRHKVDFPFMKGKYTLLEDMRKSLSANCLSSKSFLPDSSSAD